MESLQQAPLRSLGRIFSHINSHLYFPINISAISKNDLSHHRSTFSWPFFRESIIFYWSWIIPEIGWLNWLIKWLQFHGLWQDWTGLTLGSLKTHIFSTGHHFVSAIIENIHLNKTNMPIPMFWRLRNPITPSLRLSDIDRSALKREERQELCEEIYKKWLLSQVTTKSHKGIISYRK